jgi:ribose-phosphate pyrophosphokinase
MILFGLPNYEYLLTALVPISFSQKGQFRIGRHKNGELFVDLLTSVAGAACVLVGSIAPPDERLCSLLLLAHTLKKE